MADKKVVDPYQGRLERQKAIDSANRRQELPPVPERKTAQPIAPVVVPQGQPGSQPAETSQDVLLPLLTKINDRIFAYEEKKKRWGELESQFSSVKLEAEKIETLNRCGWQIDNILTKYNGFHEQLMEKKSVRMVELVSGETLLEIEKLDIDFMESECRDMLGSKQEAEPGGVVSDNRPFGLREAEKRMARFTSDGEYQQVITEYEALPDDQKAMAAYEAIMQYGRALMKQQRLADALALFEDKLQKYRQLYDSRRDFELMQILGDLRFALKKYDNARQDYENLNNTYVKLGDHVTWSSQQLNVLGDNVSNQDEVDAYAALLGAHLGYDADRDGYKVKMQAEDFLGKYPYSQVASSVDSILRRSSELAETWFAEILKQVDSQVQQEKFRDASLVIERLPKDTLTTEKQDLLKIKADELLTAEAIVIERERLAKAQILPKKWNKGMQHLEAKEYDQAIVTFKELLETEYAEKAQAQIAETTELAVVEGRRRAAELFVRANRTQDIESRKKLLVASRRLLQEILNKYPDSDLIEKVRQNLTRIEDEITAIDPALLQMAPEGEQSAGTETREGQGGVDVDKNIEIQDEENLEPVLEDATKQ